jgi:hypothetical protein
VELAGGETGDFGGGNCRGREQPVDAQVERDFALSRLRSVLASRHRLDARWVDLAHGEPVPGTAVTSIDLAVELGAVRFLVSEHELCSDRIEADVTVDLRIGDGTLAATGHGSLFQTRAAPAVHLYARAELATAAGTPDLEIDPDRPHRGQIEVVLDIFDDAVRGTVTPSVSYFASEEQARDPATWPAELRAPSVLHFPVDDCQMSELPLSADEPSALLGGRSPRDLLAEARSRLAGLGPQPARWMDETLTEVEIDFSALEPAALCADPASLAPGDGDVLPSGSSSPVTRLVGWAGTTVRSADRGLDFTIADRVRKGDWTAFYVSPETGELLQLYLSRFEDAIDAAELQARLGLALQGAASAPLQAKADLLYTFRQGSGVGVEGRLQVLELAGTARLIECIGWPVGGRFEQDCRP